MISLKKTVLSIVALGIAGVAGAGMYAPPAANGCSTGNVNVPCEKKGWSFSADALYVQTNNVGQSSITVNTTKNAEGGYTDVTENYTSFPADWQWGFELAASYLFGQGNDVTLNWTHFVHSSNQTTTGDDIYGLYIHNHLEDDITKINDLSTTVDNNFDAVNLEFGQVVHFGEHVDSRFYGGLQYAAINQSINQAGSNDMIVDVQNTGNVSSDFDGIGPRFGMDNAYNFGNGFSIFGNLAVSLLIGDISSSAAKTVGDIDGDDDAYQFSTSASTNDIVVPEAEGKLGVRYTKPLAQGDLSAEVGWEAVNYWNAVAQSDDINEQTNFAYNGLFFGLKWMGNA